MECVMLREIAGNVYWNIVLSSGKCQRPGPRVKEMAWHYVTDAVNAVNRAHPLHDVEIKFKHFKSEVKKKRVDNG